MQNKLDGDQKKTAKKHLALIALSVVSILVLLSVLSLFLNGN